MIKAFAKLLLSLSVTLLVGTSDLAYAQGAGSLFEPSTFHQLRFAHRGGYFEKTENTIETIVDNIRAHDLNAIEVDIAMTADSHLVLFHDDSINRVLNFPRHQLLSETSYDQLMSLTFRVSENPGERVASFDEFVDTLIYLAVEEERKFLVELDFKPNGDQGKVGVDRLMSVIQATENRYEKAIYEYFFDSTFYPDVLARLRNASKDIRLAFAVNSAPAYHKLKARMGVMLAPLIVRRDSAQIIEPNICHLSAGYVNRWHKRNKLINTYSANRKCEKQALEALDNPVAYTTNCPQIEGCEHDESDQMDTNVKWCKRCDSNSLEPKRDR